MTGNRGDIVLVLGTDYNGLSHAATKSVAHLTQPLAATSSDAATGPGATSATTLPQVGC